MDSSAIVSQVCCPSQTPHLTTSSAPLVIPISFPRLWFHLSFHDLYFHARSELDERHVATQESHKCAFSPQKAEFESKSVPGGAKDQMPIKTNGIP